MDDADVQDFIVKMGSVVSGMFDQPFKQADDGAKMCDYCRFIDYCRRKPKR